MNRIVKEMETRKKFAQTLGMKRYELDISQRAMAEKLGIPYRTYQQWESGVVCPREKKVEEILKKISEMGDK